MADEQYQDYPTGVDNVHTSFSMEIESPEDWPALPELSWAEFLLWVMGRRSRHRIEGHSMLPFLQPGDEVLYQPQAYRKSQPDLGAVVIVQHPHRPALVMIKRVAAMDSDASGGLQSHRYWLLGDNWAESSDSRSFGWVEQSQLLGTVVCRFHQTP